MVASTALLGLAPADQASKTTPEPVQALFPVEVSWTANLPGPAAAAPAYDAERAYVPIRPAQVVAVALSNGRVAWTVALASVVTPAVDGARVFVAADDAIHALARDTGSKAWDAAVGPVSAPLLSHGGWLIASVGAEVVALRAEDGDQLWRRSYGAAVRVVPTIEGDRLYLSLDDGRVIAARLPDGAPLWERKLGGAPHEILVSGDRVFVGSDDNFFYALADKNGDVKWRWRTGADVVGQPYADESRVYFASLDNVLRALDRRNGSQRWKTALPIRPSTGPLGAGGGSVLVVSGQGSGVRAYNARDGAEVGSFTAGAELVAPIHLHDRTGTPMLVIVTAGGVVQGLSRSFDPPIVPLRDIPGRKLPPEGAPGEPEGSALPNRD